MTQPDKKTEALIVYTVYRSDDLTNHIFSTRGLAQDFANSIEVPCVLSEYAVDCPERFYGETQ